VFDKYKLKPWSHHPISFLLKSGFHTPLIKFSALKISNDATKLDVEDSNYSNLNKNHFGLFFPYPQVLTFAYSVLPLLGSGTPQINHSSSRLQIPSSTTFGKSPLEGLLLKPQSLVFHDVLDLIESRPERLIPFYKQLITTSSTTVSDQSEENLQTKAIKIHTGSIADRITTLYNADAVTLGKNIFFSAGKLDLASPRGLALFAHEVSHINQQNDEGALQHGYVSPSKLALLEKDAQEKEQEVLQYFTNNYSVDSAQPMIRYSPSGWKSNTSISLPSFNMKVSTPENSSAQNLVFASPITQHIASEGYTNIPFTAERGRPIESGAAASPAAAAAAPQTPTPTLDINGLAERVYGMIQEKIKMQRNLIGFR
jgi:Domain of unknown function (DUF4157)